MIKGMRKKLKPCNHVPYNSSIVIFDLLSIMSRVPIRSSEHPLSMDIMVYILIKEKTEVQMD